MSRTRRRALFLTGIGVIIATGAVIAVATGGDPDTALTCEDFAVPPSTINAGGQNVDCYGTSQTATGGGSTTTTAPATNTTSAGLDYDPDDFLSSGNGIPAFVGDDPFAEGSFRTQCNAGHLNFDDPIVYPGAEAATHLHQFFGNLNIDYSTDTYEEVLGEGNSTCDGGPLNRTGYWIPALVNTDTNRVVRPTTIIIYYKLEPGSNRVPLPDGLRMVAGFDMSTGSEPTVGSANWRCQSNDYADQETITDCGPGDLLANITFPMCWDGVNLDSVNHRSHMSYTVGGTCPGSHPYFIPRISYNVTYTIEPGESGADLLLSSDVMDGSDDWGHVGMEMENEEAGFTLHGDWFGGWNTDISDTWHEECNIAFRDCGTSFLGDGRRLINAADAPIANREPIPVRPA